MRVLLHRPHWAAASPSQNGASPLLTRLAQPPTRARSPTLARSLHAPPPCPPTIPLLSTGPSIALPTLCLPLSTLDPPDKVRGRGSDQQAQRGRRRSRGTSPPHHTSCSPPTTPRLALSAPLHTAQPCTPRTQLICRCRPITHDQPDRRALPRHCSHFPCLCLRCRCAVADTGCPCRVRAARQVSRLPAHSTARMLPAQPHPRSVHPLFH